MLSLWFNAVTKWSELFRKTLRPSSDPCGHFQIVSARRRWSAFLVLRVVLFFARPLSAATSGLSPKSAVLRRLSLRSVLNIQVSHSGCFFHATVTASGATATAVGVDFAFFEGFTSTVPPLRFFSAPFRMLRRATKKGGERSKCGLESTSTRVSRREEGE